MKHILFCVLAYTVFTNICAHVKISKVGTRGDTEERHKSGISAITVSKTIAEVGKIFEYGMVAGINKIKKVGDKEKVGFLLKKFPFLKHTPKLAGTFGALGTMLSIVFSFIPKEDTPEIAMMKKEFSEMNTKLDIITSSLDESKKLIRESSQKASYLQAEHKIIQAYKQLESLISNLIDLSCDSLKDCKYKKMKMVDNYKDRLNVRREVEMILRGTSQDSVFGTSLLILISEASGCYISKIKNFKSAVAALDLKGSSASAFYDMITKGNYDMTSDVRRFQKLMFDLEKKSENIIFDCYKNINRYLFSDSIDLDQTLSQLSMQEANKHTLKYLCMKYSWIEFYVISVDGDSTPLFWANDSFHNELNSEYSSKSKMARNYIVIGSRNRVENSITKKERFRDKLTKTKLHYRSWFQSHYDQAIERLLNVMEYDKYLHNQFRTIAVVPKYKSAIIGYAEKDFTLKQIKMKEYDTITRNDILAFRQCPNDVSCTSDSESTAIIASIYSKDQDISDCTSTCSHRGTCYFLPHTKTMACKCNVEHYGDDCSSTATDTSMALDLIKLIDISSKLPTLFDVSTQLGYVRETLQADLNDIHNSIQAIDDELTNLFDHFKRDLMSTLDLYGLMTQYCQIIRDLKYYFHILVERDGSTIRTNRSLKQILSRSRMLPYVSLKEKTELAKKIVQPTVLRRSLEYLSYLFVGRQDIPLISHQPLLFLIMKKHHSKLCTSEYKNILDNAYIQLAILEFEGYFLWMHALKLLNEDTSFVAKQYNDVVDAHERFLEYSTCKVRIQILSTLRIVRMDTIYTRV